MYLCIPPYQFWMAEPAFIKLVMYIMTPDRITSGYFVDLSHQSVGLYVARQRLGNNVTAAKNTYATIEGFLDP
jgi:hypothetical protein